eukprot:8332168-Ditylum_brightwellii.AAC.1
MFCQHESHKKGLTKYQDAERDEARNAGAVATAKQKQKINNKNQQNNEIEEGGEGNIEQTSASPSYTIRADTIFPSQGIVQV